MKGGSTGGKRNRKMRARQGRGDQGHPNTSRSSDLILHGSSLRSTCQRTRGSPGDGGRLGGGGRSEGEARQPGLGALQRYFNHRSFANIGLLNFLNNFFLWVILHLQKRHRNNTESSHKRLAQARITLTSDTATARESQPESSTGTLLLTKIQTSLTCHPFFHWGAFPAPDPNPRRHTALSHHASLVSDV